MQENITDKLLNDLNSVFNKARGYQFTEEELKKYELNQEKHEFIRKAINSTAKTLDNSFTRFLSFILKPINDLFDSIIKIILTVCAFIFFLQASTFNFQAEKSLNEIVANAEKENSKYTQIKEEIFNKLKELDLDKEDIKEQRKIIAINAEKKQKENLKWLEYKNKSITTIWADLPKDWSKAQDLFYIYSKTFEYYQKPLNLFFSLPQEAIIYFYAFVQSLCVLFIYIIIKSLLGFLIVSSFRSTILKKELREALKKI